LRQSHSSKNLNPSKDEAGEIGLGDGKLEKHLKTSQTQKLTLKQITIAAKVNLFKKIFAYISSITLLSFRC
jgi:hypothetical protein